MAQSAAHSGTTVMGVNVFILMERGFYEWKQRIRKLYYTDNWPKMEGLFLVVFQQRRVSSMDMKHAVTVSYLNMSLGGKVRQQLTDVLQPAWPLKHISMVMDVRCSLKKPIACPWFLSPFLTTVFLNLFFMLHKMNQHYKQVKIIEGRGEQECSWVRAQGLLSPTNLPVWPISSTWDGGLDGHSVVFISESCERCE